MTTVNCLNKIKCGKTSIFLMWRPVHQPHVVTVEIVVKNSMRPMGATTAHGKQHSYVGNSIEGV